MAIAGPLGHGRAMTNSTTPLPLPDLLRGLEIVAARRPGSYGDDTQIHEVVAPNAIGPSAFLRVLTSRLHVSAREIEKVDMRDGRMTLGELYGALTR